MEGSGEIIPLSLPIPISPAHTHTHNITSTLLMELYLRGWGEDWISLPKHFDKVSTAFLLREHHDS